MARLVGLRPVRDRLDRFQRIDRPAAAIVGVLQADEPGVDGVHVVGADLALEVGDAQQAIAAVDRPAGDAAERRRAAGFPEADVAGRFEEDFVLRSAVDADRDLVRHRSRWDEEAGFLAEEGRGAAFEFVDGGVFAEDVIADRRGRHGREHAGRRLRDGVAAEVDHGGVSSHQVSGHQVHKSSSPQVTRPGDLGLDDLRLDD